MIDLTGGIQASPRVHAVAADPGCDWVVESRPALDAPPDSDPCPDPEATWESSSPRTGLCGAVSPRVVRLPSGLFRVFYSQILPRAGYPAGANDYDHATTRIVSAVSEDGLNWTPEPGVRISSEAGGAGDSRVVSSEVVPDARAPGRLRMYYECCRGVQGERSSIRSAVSDDEGLTWEIEPGERLALGDEYVSSPRILFLDDGRCRLFFLRHGIGIASATSEDGGTSFHLDAGVRIAMSEPLSAHTAFACDFSRVAHGPLRMYFAGYSRSDHAHVLTAMCHDDAAGMDWQIDANPVLEPSGEGVAGFKCSEMCIVSLPGEAGSTPRFSMLFEACDGTVPTRRGVWRVAIARSC